MKRWILLLLAWTGCDAATTVDMLAPERDLWTRVEGGDAAAPGSDLSTPPDIASAAPDIASAAPDIAVAPPDIAVAPPDMAVAPPDIASAPPDIAIAPPDIASAPPDIAVAPRDLATAPPDLARSFNCKSFATPSGWKTDPGFRAVVVATAMAGLSQPVALAFAGGAYGDRLYVVNQGNNSLVAIDLATGATKSFTAGNQWAAAPRLLTTIVWDAGGVFDGRVYVGDQGTDGDGDSVLYRVAPDGAATVLAKGPGPGLDDIYGLAFSPGGGGFTRGLYVTGDTDGVGVDWGVFDAAGKGTPFSEVAGAEGIAFDVAGDFGGGLLASRPATGGYAGDDTISRIKPDGTLGAPLSTKLPGIHAVVLSPGGVFGKNAYAASWASNRLVRVAPNGAVTDVATGLALTNYDGNILALSPDGNTLLVADRQANRVVCIEPL